MRSPSQVRRARGTATLETLLAVPIVLLLGFGALQWALLFHARAALEHALLEAARAGSVAHASPTRIDAGLARGLIPYWAHEAGGAGSYTNAFAQAQARLAFGLSAGWVLWQQLSPTRESFADWGEPARDAAGMPIPDLIEIPNDNLRWHRQRQPKQALREPKHDDIVGEQSLQTLNDANLLKLELRYGVPMTVPLVGRFAVWIMRIVDGCETAQPLRLGSVDMGMPQVQANPRAWACAMYLAPDESGRAVPRWPLRTSATIRMQTPARLSERMISRTQTPVYGRSLGLGEVDPAEGFRSIGYRQDRGGGKGGDTGAAAPSSGNPTGQGGTQPRLQIGGDRAFSVPGACP